MSFMPEDREPAWYPTALLYGDDGRPLIDWKGRTVPFDPRLSDANEPEEVDGVLEFRASICDGPRSYTDEAVTEEQHRFIAQFEEARERQEEAERECAEARWAPPPPPPPPREPEPEEIPAQGKLNPRQEAFCRHYAAQPVATHAAALAGYAEDFAKNQGYRLLKNPLVLARIAEHRAERNLVYALDRDTLHDKLEALFFDALGERNHAAAVAALRLQAGLGGLLRPAPARRRASAPGKRAAKTTDDDQ